MNDDLQETAVLSALNLLNACGLEMTYDPKNRLVYIYLDKQEEGWIGETVEWHESVIADFRDDGKLVGIAQDYSECE